MKALVQLEFEGGVRHGEWQPMFAAKISKRVIESHFAKKGEWCRVTLIPEPRMRKPRDNARTV